MPQQWHAKAGSRWHISAGSTGALASALQTAGLIIPSMWPHFQASRPSLKRGCAIPAGAPGQQLGKQVFLPCGALGREPLLKIRFARRPILGEEIKEFCYERWGRWDTYMESPPGDISWTHPKTVRMQFCAVFCRETLLEHGGRMRWLTVVPFRHDPFCESVVL